MLLRLLFQLNISAAACKVKPLERYPCVIRLNVTGFWLRPELYAALLLRLAVGYSDILLCVYCSPVIFACISCCFTEILLFRAYSTQRSRLHLSWPYILHQQAITGSKNSNR